MASPQAAAEWLKRSVGCREARRGGLRVLSVASAANLSVSFVGLSMMRGILRFWGKDRWWGADAFVILSHKLPLWDPRGKWANLA